MSGMRTAWSVAVIAACVPDATPIEPEGDAGASAWSLRAPIPEGRSAAAAGVLDGRLYVAGGYAVDTQLARLDVYDPLADAWSARAPLPDARHTDAAAVAIDGRLYVAGGSMLTQAGQQCTDAVAVYHPGDDAWQAGPPMPGRRCWAAVAALDGRVYVAGGTNTQGSIVYGELFVLDVAAGIWSEGPPLPTPRLGMGAAALDGRIHFVGGYVGQTKYAETEVYDPEAQAWEARAPLSAPRSSFCLLAHEGRLHAIGGQPLGDGHATGRHEIHDPAGDLWSEAEAMPTPRIAPACGVLAGALVVTGGADALTAFGVSEAFTP